MDPYEEYMRSLRPDLYSRGAPMAAASSGAMPSGTMGALGKIGTGVGIAGDVIGTAASLYGTYKAIEEARKDRRYQRERDAKSDLLAEQDRMERRRHAGKGEVLQAADRSTDFMDNLMNMYRTYNGGYFNLHG